MYILKLGAVLSAIHYSASYIIFEPKINSGNEPQIYQHDGVPGHQLRIRPTNKDICATTDEGIAGYVDIGRFPPLTCINGRTLTIFKTKETSIYFSGHLKVVMILCEIP